jgi:group I intron endonuclease
MISGSKYMHYIYKITNLINGKCYIGQTNNPKNRWKTHKYEGIRNRKQGNFPIYNAMRKYGIDNFSFEIIDECQTIDEANLSEIWNIRNYLSLINENGYNIEFGGNNKTVSDETRKKQSESHKGKLPWNKNIPCSEESKEKNV